MPLCCRIFDRTNDWEIPAEEIEICKNEKGEDWRLGSGQCTAELLLHEIGSHYICLVNGGEMWSLGMGSAC